MPVQFGLVNRVES